MSTSDFVVNATRNTRLTSKTFDIKTRVTAKPKSNTFWRSSHSAPGECITIKNGLQVSQSH
jgi:hypothetical protein